MLIGKRWLNLVVDDFQQGIIESKLQCEHFLREYGSFDKLCFSDYLQITMRID